MTREELISQLAELIADIKLPHPVRVGIDGVDASGKTMLANELVEPIERRGRHVMRVSIDGFHNSSEIRHRQGRYSPRGYYEDSFNHDAILSCVLAPLGLGGDLRYRTAQFDFRNDSEVDSSVKTAQPDSVLLFEGIFLHRPQLVSHWDFSIFVEASFAIVVQRALVRDQYLFGTPDKIREIYQQRYVPGQKIYLEAVRPFEKADVVVDNNDIRNPKLKSNKK